MDVKSLVCIKHHSYVNITKDKVYEISMIGDMSVFIDDDGVYRSYNQYDFCFITVQRFRDNKLNNLL